MKKRYFLPLVALALVTLVGCGNNEENPDTNGDGDTANVCEDPSIILDASKTSLVIGETSTLTSTIVGCENGTVTYSIRSGESAVELSSDGIVTAISEGTATIRATLDDNEDVFDEVTLSITSINEHIEKVYDGFDSFNYENGVTINANLEINLGTLNAGDYITNQDFVVDIPFDITVGTYDDDPIVKASLVLEDISGASFTLAGIDISEMIGLPAGTYVYDVTIDVIDIVKSYLAQYIFTNQYSDDSNEQTYKNIEVINIYSTGGSDLYVELQEKNSNGGALQTMEDGFYTFDISELVSSLDDMSSSSWEKSDIANLISMIETIATSTTTESTYNLTFGETGLELINSFWSSLNIGGDYDINIAEIYPDITQFGIDELILTGLRVPSTITDISGTIYNYPTTGLEFDYIEFSISGTTENTEESEFLNLQIYWPEQRAKGTTLSIVNYLNNLISEYA